MRTTCSVFFAVLFLIADFHRSALAQDSATDNQIVKSYIDRFRQGEHFNHGTSVTDLASAIQFSPTPLALLTAELAAGTPDVRLNIVQLLERVGFELAPPAPHKFQVIRDHRIIRALVVQGFAKDDAAANAAADVLLFACTPSDLARFNDIYTKSLRQLSGQYLRLATKAKTVEASAYIEKMAQAPKWQREPERYEVIQIARAALGNQLVEDKFIEALSDAEKNLPPAPKNRFYNVGAARDATEVAQRLGALGAIGTRRSLQIVCSYLRATLQSYVVGVSERSVRYAALDALRYNFPDERVIQAPRQLTDWRAAEEFCTDHVGAVFDGPTPDTPPHHAYPHL